MITDAAWAVQTALFTALSGDPALGAIIGNPARVHDAVPSDAVFPLVQIGACRMTPIAGADGSFEHVLRVTAYSRWGGRSECKAIASCVRSILEGAKLTLAGHQMVQSRLIFEDHLRYRDPDTFQAAMRYRVLTTPEEADL